MPCSVVDTGDAPLSGGLSGSKKERVIGLPIQNASGEGVTVLTSSTLDPEVLREVRDLAAKSSNLRAGSGLPERLILEMGEF